MTRSAAGLAAVLLLALAAPVFAQEPPVASVTAVRETEPVDVDPDDPAIWVNPADPLQSRVLGTDKDFGLVVFDLDGKTLQKLADGRLNNVDLRTVTLGGTEVTLVAASKREDNTIVFYTIAADGTVAHAPTFGYPGAPAEIDDDIYGIGFYLDTAGALSVVASFKTGDVVQWVIGGTPDAMTLTFARQWLIPSQPEGVVADDQLGYLYIGEEDGGIWRFDATPTGSTDGTLVDAVGSACLPVDDVEGMGVYATGPDTGWLVVSAQGVNRYALYPRKPDADGKQNCIGSFGIATGATDPVGETDGLEVTSANLGPDFPQGLMVVQDDRNEGFSRNFKYVSWADVNAALGLSAD
ncbi:MAG: phytase [Devosia sp.]